MLASSSSFLSSFSHSPCFVSSPRRICIGRCKAQIFKLFDGRVSGVGFARYGRAAACLASDEVSDVEEGGQISVQLPKRDSFFVLRVMEERGIRAECSTYASLLDSCLSSGSVVDLKRIHSRVLKLGFDYAEVICNRLLGGYLEFGEVVDAVKVFDDMPVKSLVAWNKLIVGLARRNEHHKVVKFFARMVHEAKHLDPIACASALRACIGNTCYWQFVQQTHAKLFRLGLSSDSVVGNPLIDLYAKFGRMDLARSVFEGLHSKDYVSWVAVVSGFCQNGLGEESLGMYRVMHRSDIVPTPYVLSSVLSACTRTDNFEHGMVIHGQVVKRGFSSETFVGNALVTLYSRWGSLKLADLIFTEMPFRDRVTYNTLISGHAQHGNGDTALEIFENMQHSGIRPDSVTIASLLTACSSVGDIHKGRQLHSYVFKSGLSSDYIIEGSILDLYVKCGDVEAAHEFFDTTDRKNIVLWNVMLVAYGQMGDLIRSFGLFYQMLVEGMEPNDYTYPSVLRTCTFCGELDLGQQIHTLTIKTGFQLNAYVCSVLIDMYSKCGMLGNARTILNRIPEKDVISWTAMIAGYAQHGYYVEALETFKEMQIYGILPDNIGLASAISACAGLKAIKRGLQIHAHAFISGYSMDISIGNSLINLYARCGLVNEAYSTFKTIEPKDEISWNGLISGFAQSGNYEEALKVFEKMEGTCLKPNEFTFGSVLSASANLADIKQGKQIHGKIIKTGHNSEIEVSNALISLYAKCGDIEDAEMEFLSMRVRNEISWNAMITAFSQHGHGHEAIKLFEQMKIEQFDPNHVTFIAVLAACSHVGLVNEGLDYFNSMTAKHDLPPRPDHYACVVDILGRAGKLERARAFIDEMPITPDAMVWRTLLSACTVHKNIEIGELAAQHLLQLAPDDSATYVLLSNIYAVMKKWNSRDEMRQLMKDRRVKKEPGRSWIEVKNEIHAFFVGDKLHAQADEIYKLLENLNSRAAAIGYKHDKRYLLHESDQEEKDPTSYIHSEKLAIAFGLMSLPPEIPLRVIKNLRVCNDCHTWIKFISRIMERKIILRDPYRFHHFDSGCCSCGDYW